MIILLIISLIITSSFANRFYDPDVGAWVTPDPKEQFSSPYLYAGNGYNPLNGVDFDGLNITALNDKEGAGGFGHNAVLIGNKKIGYFYFSRDGKSGDVSRNVTLWFKSKDEFWSSEDPTKGVLFVKRYDRQVEFTTTQDQDVLMVEKGNENLLDEDYQSYNFLLQNCSELVSDFFNMIGIEGVDPPTPNQQYDVLKEEKGSIPSDWSFK